MTVGGKAFIITNDEPILFWEFGRQLGDAAGFPTNRASVRSIPLFVGLVIAFLVEWVVWLTSLGKKRSKMSRVAIRYSALTRTYRIDKAKRVLGYRPLVSLSDGIVRSGKFFSKEGKKSK
jgi:sterol-4alpha-carboxylate 3-dehydrogenase (decarboxylating)